MEAFKSAEIEVDVVRLDSDIIDEHLKNSTAVLHDILSGNVAEIGHVCTVCRKIYKTSNTLRAHCLFKHPDDSVEGHCNLCDKTYPSLLSLKKHVKYMHQYSHRCKACYKTFERAELLDAHRAACSNVDTPCSVCGKILNSDLALRNHIKYKHADSDLHRCVHCKRTFTNHCKLSNHMTTAHVKGGMTCLWCDKAFNSTTALQSHILYKHTDDKAKCPHCSKVFAKKIFLQKHMSRKHVGL